MKFKEFLIQESKDRHAVLAFGRLQPPTTGHEVLVNKVKEVAKQHNAEHHIVLSHSNDPKQNPLTPQQKVKHAKRFFPGTNITTSDKEAPNFLTQASKLHKSGVTHLHMIAGSDRTSEYKKVLKKYNGTHEGALFNFKKIEVHSAGQRDPDAEGTTGMSGSKMRAHAQTGKFKEFKKGVPGHVSDTHAKELYNDLRKGMNMIEDINKSFENVLLEGVHDQSIFKAVFLAGGPGSGKSFIVGKTALTALGFKVINSDDVFERALAKVGLKPTPEDIYSPLGQQTRDQAKVVTGKKMELAIAGRLGLVIDGTGKDYAKIEKQADKLRAIGYEVAMIFVNTDLDTALVRNRMRSRSLPDDEVSAMWKDVQKNLGKFQNFFRQKMFIIDNSEGSNYEGAVLSTYRKIAGWAKTKPETNAANDWIKAQSVKEEHGAGDMGTTKLTKKYKKDTPNQSVNESFENILNEETQCALITQADIRELEKFADDLLAKYGIDIEFTKHFGDRMSDERNVPCINVKELKDFFRKVYANAGAKIKGNVGLEVVIKDIQKSLNMPVVIDRKQGEVEVTFKTIMRKKNFTSPNKTVQY